MRGVPRHLQNKTLNTVVLVSKNVNKIAFTVFVTANDTSAVFQLNAFALVIQILINKSSSLTSTVPIQEPYTVDLFSTCRTCAACSMELLIVDLLLSFEFRMHFEHFGHRTHTPLVAW